MLPVNVIQAAIMSPPTSPYFIWVRDAISLTVLLVIQTTASKGRSVFTLPELLHLKVVSENSCQKMRRDGAIVKTRIREHIDSLSSKSPKVLHLQHKEIEGGSWMKQERRGARERNWNPAEALISAHLANHCLKLQWLSNHWFLKVTELLRSSPHPIQF